MVLRMAQHRIIYIINRWLEYWCAAVAEIALNYSRVSWLELKINKWMGRARGANTHRRWSESEGSGQGKKGEKMATFGSANIWTGFNEQWTQHACKYLNWNWVPFFCCSFSLSLHLCHACTCFIELNFPMCWLSNSIHHWALRCMRTPFCASSFRYYLYRTRLCVCVCV